MKTIVAYSKLKNHRLGVTKNQTKQGIIYVIKTRSLAKNHLNKSAVQEQEIVLLEETFMDLIKLSQFLVKTPFPENQDSMFYSLKKDK